MKTKKLLARLLAMARLARSLAEPSLALLTRVVIGYAFYVAGSGKLAHFDSTVQFFASLGLPAPALNAGFIATLEVVGGIALIFGCATRVFALLLSSTMVVALATAHAGDIASALSSGGKGSLTDITAFVYLLLLGWLAVGGAGLASIDAMFGRRVLGLLEGDGADQADERRTVAYSSGLGS